MIIITDLLIIDRLISVYLPLVFRHLNSWPYLILNLNKYSLLPTVVSEIAEWVANSVDPDEMPCLQCLTRVYTVCLGLSDQIHIIKYNKW